MARPKFCRNRLHRVRTYGYVVSRVKVKIRLKRTYLGDDDSSTLGKLGLGRDTTWVGGDIESEGSGGEGGRRSEGGRSEGEREREGRGSRRGGTSQLGCRSSWFHQRLHASKSVVKLTKLTERHCC